MVTFWGCWHCIFSFFYFTENRVFSHIVYLDYRFPSLFSLLSSFLPPVPYGCLLFLTDLKTQTSLLGIIIKQNNTQTNPWKLDKTIEQKETAQEKGLESNPFIYALRYSIKTPNRETYSMHKGPDTDSCRPSTWCCRLYEFTWAFWFRGPCSPGITPWGSHSLSTCSPAESPEPWRKGFDGNNPFRPHFFQGLSLWMISGFWLWDSLFVPICWRRKLIWWWLIKALILEYSRVLLGILLLLWVFLFVLFCLFVLYKSHTCFTVDP